jgi:hypothetical protein
MVFLSTLVYGSTMEFMHEMGTPRKASTALSHCRADAPVIHNTYHPANQCAGGAASVPSAFSAKIQTRQ